MNSLYLPNEDHTLGYAGNKIFKPIKSISNDIGIDLFRSRLK